MIVSGQGEVIVDTLLTTPLSNLPPENGGADELHRGEDDQADAGREKREEPEESRWPFNGINFGKKLAWDSY